VRDLFLSGLFVEVDFLRPAGAGFRVGAHRFVGTPVPVTPGLRLFDFV